MASTRNRNTVGDHALEQHKYARQFEFYDHNKSVSYTHLTLPTKRIV